MVNEEYIIDKEMSKVIRENTTILNKQFMLK